VKNCLYIGQYFVKKFVNDNSGTIVLLFALALSAFVAAAALALNVARAYYLQSRMTSAADVAALAGAIQFYNTSNEQSSKASLASCWASLRPPTSILNES
jgi:Flp pilus assembly protein TadG